MNHAQTTKQKTPDNSVFGAPFTDLLQGVLAQPWDGYHWHYYYKIKSQGGDTLLIECIENTLIFLILDKNT